MDKLFWCLFTLYLAAAAGFGGWRVQNLWSGWFVWCFLLPPLAWWGLQAIHWWRGGGPIKVAAAIGAVAFVAIGASALLIAWVIAEASEKWSANPVVRAAIGAALGTAVGGLIFRQAQKAAEARRRNVSESAGGLAEPDAPADGGRDAGS